MGQISKLTVREMGDPIIDSVLKLNDGNAVRKWDKASKVTIREMGNDFCGNGHTVRKWVRLARSQEIWVLLGRL